MKASIRKYAPHVIKIIFVLLVLYFMGGYFLENRDTLRQMQWQPDPLRIVLSFLLYFVYMLTLASLWHCITKQNGCSIRHADAVTAYLLSIPGKYIPGKVFLLMARCPAYERANQPIRKVTVCFFLENICTLLGAAFLFLLSLFFFPDAALRQYQSVTILMIVLFFICIHPGIINFFLRIAGKLFRKDMEISITYPDMLRIVLLFIGNWLIAGAGFYLLVDAIYPVTADHWLYVGGIYGLSTIIGILALFAPSGLGVREGILIAGLLYIMPEEYAVTVACISRLWQTAAELILVVFAWAADRIRKLKTKN